MNFWNQILAKLQSNQKVYLLTVIDNFGSSPGRRGFRMCVAEDGQIFGSIGGGVMEFQLVEEAKVLLRNKDYPIVLKRQIHKGKVKDGSGMICSGEQTVVFHPLNSENSSQIKFLIECLSKRKIGTLYLSHNTFDATSEVMNTKFETEIKNASNWSYSEQLGIKDRFYIIGAGHVGLACSELFKTLGFEVILIDNREGLNTFVSNVSAHQKHIIDYKNVENYVEESDTSYVAIMTNRYTDDKLVLSKLLSKQNKFIGVLGSKAKLKTMFEVLEEKDGFSKVELNKVSAPIGVSIKSQSPEEIAVSIAAEVIQLKNEK